MITLHRLGHGAEPFQLNPDLIVTIEAHPDTVLTLTTGTKIVVAETPEIVVAEVRDWRASIIAEATRRRKQPLGSGEGTIARRAAQPALVAVQDDDERRAQD
jgi:flagellar protein FlbD